MFEWRNVILIASFCSETTSTSSLKLTYNFPYLQGILLVLLDAVTEHEDFVNVKRRNQDEQNSVQHERAEM